jgi:hypothetical protein
VIFLLFLKFGCYLGAVRLPLCPLFSNALRALALDWFEKNRVFLNVF